MVKVVAQKYLLLLNDVVVRQQVEKGTDRLDIAEGADGAVKAQIMRNIYQGRLRCVELHMPFGCRSLLELSIRNHPRG